MLSTVRQVGSVIGTAAVGALLRNRLVSPLSSQAAIRSAGLPTPVRGTFIGGYRQAAATGLTRDEIATRSFGEIVARRLKT